MGEYLDRSFRITIQWPSKERALVRHKEKKKSVTKLKEAFGLSYCDKNDNINATCFIIVRDCENYYLLLFPGKK